VNKLDEPVSETKFFSIWLMDWVGPILRVLEKWSGRFCEAFRNRTTTL